MATPLQIAVYISGHGYGHFTRTVNLLSLLSHAGNFTFHIRTSSPLHPAHVTYELQPTVIQTNAYQLDGEQSLQSLQTFDPSLAQKEETFFLRQHGIDAIFSDALPLPCLLAHSLKIPSILITNFTFDSIFQAILDDVPNHPNKAALQLKVDEMVQQYSLAYSIIRLPGYIPFLFRGPQIVDVPMHSRKALRNRNETLADLGLQGLEEKKILLHCFGGQSLDAPSKIPTLPEGWVCVSQTIDYPPFFYKISRDVYMPDVVGACDAVLGKLGWGTCSEVIGNGYKPFIYVPRSAFVEEVGLLPWMETAHRRIVRLEVENYESSDWKGAIEEAQETYSQYPELKVDWAKNDADLVRIVEETLQSALA
ncbi:L-arabinokinase [Lachnellula suecica]|uniref:L-arabinokinase n=1 Tax=Lachnellula suecica TaxID=602035 RepID=A0A8T9C9Z4_9HELO|nr:L-arabinokinase [Lachnellula suecica]